MKLNKLITCAIPIASDENIHKDVLFGLGQQTADFDIRISQLSRLDSYNREISINFNRHNLQKQLMECTSEYIMLMDSDVVIEDPTTVSRMAKYLDDNMSVGCVSVDTKQNVNFGHICCALSMIRKSQYITLDYISNPVICQCNLIFMKTVLHRLTDIKAHEILKGN